METPRDCKGEGGVKTYRFKGGTLIFLFSPCSQITRRQDIEGFFFQTPEKRPTAPGSVVDAYEQVQKGLLKPKGVAELRVTKRKKKKKDKDKAKLPESMGMNKKNEEQKQHGLDKRTPARAAFEKMQEKRQWKGSSRKASKTHKQRVEDFNRHRDTLTEHYIPSQLDEVATCPQ
ncbi:protein FAM32A-like [Pongo pygmaeus]|uniref:protein FAM32A-like n=1 Tax=Pongo pygmaeus TaxID=9600 RepID=UPI00300DA142